MADKTVKVRIRLKNTQIAEFINQMIYVKFYQSEKMLFMI